MIWVCLLADANNLKIYLTYTCLADILTDHYKEGYGASPRWTNIINATDSSIGKELQVIKRKKTYFMF